MFPHTFHSLPLVYAYTGFQLYNQMRYILLYVAPLVSHKCLVPYCIFNIENRINSWADSNNGSKKPKGQIPWLTKPRTYTQNKTNINQLTPRVIWLYCHIWLSWSNDNCHFRNGYFVPFDQSRLVRGDNFKLTLKFSCCSSVISSVISSKLDNIKNTIWCDRLIVNETTMHQP